MWVRASSKLWRQLAGLSQQLKHVITFKQSQASRASEGSDLPRARARSQASTPIVLKRKIQSHFHLAHEILVFVTALSHDTLGPGS